MNICPIHPVGFDDLRSKTRLACRNTFSSEVNGGAYSARSAQEIIKQVKTKANIKKAGSMHGLRHTYATHLLENGTDIRFIQELMGHSTLKTTMRYTHVAVKAIAAIQSPIDRLRL